MADDFSPAPQARRISRREMFTGFFGQLGRVLKAGAPPEEAQPVPPAPSAEAEPMAELIAVISGRDCIAYQGVLCTLCIDHCPVPGALVREGELPVVVPALCTGCRLCQEPCPAPTNAIHMVPRPPGLPRKELQPPEAPSPFPELG